MYTTKPHLLMDSFSRFFFKKRLYLNGNHDMHIISMELIISNSLHTI